MALILHHATALALFGWYLMVSPPVSDWPQPRETPSATKPSTKSADYSVFGFFAPPLSKWTKQGEFDSRTDCESARQHLKSHSSAEANRSPNNARQDVTSWAWCIASHDTRLKDK
jgi:hypothetical protein